MLDLRIQLTLKVIDDFVYAHEQKNMVEELLFDVTPDEFELIAAMPEELRFEAMFASQFLVMLIVNSEIPDDFNNVGRYCSIPGDKVNRRNRVMARVNYQRLVNEWGHSYYRPSAGYLCLNIDTNRVRVVLSQDMRNLY